MPGGRTCPGPVPGAIRSCRSTRRTCVNCCRPPSPARSRLPATLHGTGRSRPTWSWPPAARPPPPPAVACAVGLDVATLASPGLLVQTEPLPAFTDKVVYLPGGPGPQVHLRQRPDGSVLLGERSQEMVTHDPSERHA